MQLKHNTRVHPRVLFLRKTDANVTKSIQSDKLEYSKFEFTNTNGIEKCHKIELKSVQWCQLMNSGGVVVPK